MSTEIRWSSTNIHNVSAGELRIRYNAAGHRILRYYIDFSHKELNLHKEVSAPEISILQNKVDTLIAGWDKKFEAHEKRKNLAAGKELAESLTIEAEIRRSKLTNILHHTLYVDDAVDWDILKDHSQYEKEKFPEPRPKNEYKIPRPICRHVGFLASLFGERKKAENEYQAAMEIFESQTKKAEEKSLNAQKAWRKKVDCWEREQLEKKHTFEAAQHDANGKVDKLRDAWEAGDEKAILEHASIVLDASEYDELVTKEYQLQYEIESKTMLVEYRLPSPDDLPTVKTVRFTAATGELKETQIAIKDKKLLFDEMCYQICLRTIHELFEADTAGHINTILFNGSTKYFDKATGAEVNTTIMSLLVNRDEFTALNLDKIEPKACFKSLKGVSAATLIGMSPIAPIMELAKDDKRFIDSQTIDLDEDGSTNLAAMDWEEFEHLVREVFDKEFATRGGEVRVTQSSSDGGVDAIAFDPDPISGGKIIIQAKRYTKTVGVAAVRDLYGTTMNEGANKGILITTADFGPDAYKFAADKPLTLMTGANLLHLLSKHGINAKIDLRAARKELGLRERD